MKYFMVGQAVCLCHPNEVLYEIDADSDELAFQEAERWWHEKLSLHTQSYSLCKRLEVKTTSKAMALAKVYGNVALESLGAKICLV